MVSVGASVGFVALLGAFMGTAPSVPVEITVTATDYAFAGVPATVRPGSTFFAFRNEGKVRHELSIVRLKDGVTPDQAVTVIKTGGRRRDSTDGAALIVVAAPGDESSRARLVFDLKRGETYLVVCTLKDKPDMPPHIMFGMYASFRVE